MKIRDFHYFLFEPTKIRNMGAKLLYGQWSRFYAKFLISRLKIRGAMAISLVAMATAILILSLDVVSELIEARISFTYFSGSLVESFCSPCLFSENLG